jgi:hypothetical protein
MTQQETLSMVAKARDQASGPLRKVEDALRGIGKQGGEQSKLLRENFKSVHEQFHKVADVAKEAVSPAIEAIGISSLTAVGGMAALVHGLKSFVDQGEDIAAFGRKVMLTTDTIRGLEGAADKFHVDPGAIRQGEQGFARQMHLMRLHLGAFQHLHADQPGFAEQLATTPETIKGTEAALKTYLALLEKIKAERGEPTARLFDEEMTGTDVFVDMLRDGVDALDKAKNEHLSRAGPMDFEASKKWTENWTNFKSSIEGVRNAIGNDLLPVMTELATQVDEFFSENNVKIGHDIADVVREIGAELMGIKEFLKDPVEWFKKDHKKEGSDPGWRDINAFFRRTLWQAYYLPGVKRTEIGGGGDSGFWDMGNAGGSDAASPRQAGGPGNTSGVHAGGIGAWWTPEHIQHAVNYLKENANLPELGARALVARWAAVESPDAGPSAINPISGAIGIHQALSRSRKEGIVLGDFEGQLARVAAELKGPEGRAYQMLAAARNPLEAATGASQFERAEGYDQATGADAFVRKTVAAMRALPPQTESQPGSLLAAAGKSGLMGVGAATVTGSASLKVDINAPAGTKVRASGDGLFDRVEVNRGISMPQASEGN